MRFVPVLVCLLLVATPTSIAQEDGDAWISIDRQLTRSLAGLPQVEIHQREWSMDQNGVLPPVDCDSNQNGETNQFIRYPDRPNSFRFRESQQSAGCGRLVVDVPAPTGSTTLMVEFEATRQFRIDPGSQWFPRFIQEVSISNGGEPSNSCTYYDPGAEPLPLFAPHQCGGAVAPSNLQVDFWFEDGGMALAAQASGNPSLISYVSEVRDVKFVFPGHLTPPFDATKASALAGTGLDRTETLRVQLDAPPPGFGQRLAMEYDVANKFLQVTAPDGTVYDASSWDAQELHRVRQVIVPHEVFEAHGPGNYEIEFERGVTVRQVPLMAGSLAVLGFGQVVALGLTASTYAHSRQLFKRVNANIGKYALITLIASLVAGLAIMIWLFATRSWQATSTSPISLQGFIVFVFVVISTGSLVLVWQVMLGTERVARHQIELERSNRELDEFSHIVTHDLRAPLRTVATFAGLLKKKHGGGLNAEGEEFVDLVTGGVNRMSKLLDAVGHYSRVGSKKLLTEDVSLQDIVMDVRRDLRRDLIDSGARIHSSDLPVIHAEPALMRELLLNLVQNSIKFRHPDRRPVIQIRAKLGAAGLILTIADNGLGMGPSELKHVFEPFQRGTSAAEIPGTGMGLAVCRRIAERHGGRLDVESQQGASTTFFLHLPDA